MNNKSCIFVILILFIYPLAVAQTVTASDSAESYSGTDYTDENLGIGFASQFQYNKFGESDAGNEYLEIIRQVAGNKSFGLAAGQTGTGRAVTRTFTNVINSLHRLEVSFRFDIDVNAIQTAGFLISDSVHNAGDYWTKGQVIFIGTSGNGTWVYDDDGPSVNPVAVKDLFNNDFTLSAGDLYRLILDFNPSGTGFLAGQYAFQIENLNTSEFSQVMTGNLLRDSIRSIGFGNGVVDTLQNLIWDNILLTSDPVDPLPVELESFTANLVGNQVRLNWKTITEIDNYGFEVERLKYSLQPAGDEGIKELQDWEVIGFVEGHGTTNLMHLYQFIDASPSDINRTLSYRLKQIDTDGSYTYSDAVTVQYILAKQFLLGQNYPNPFNPETKISYEIPESGMVKLKVFDSLGREIAVLVDSEQKPGRFELIFDGTEYPSGVYIYQLKTNSFVSTKKMLLLR